MDKQNIGFLRLKSQALTLENMQSSIKNLVAHMGAIQAQDFAMCRWALGCRVDGVSALDVEAVFNAGDIIRTHLLRPTWHLVSADDLWWMLQLTAPQIKTSIRPRFIHWGFTDELLHRAYDVIQEKLSGNVHKTRDELMVDLAEKGINTDEGRAYHLMLWAELDGIVCSGAIKAKEQTYALIDERIKLKSNYTKEEAAAKLAERYFISHGAATLADFVWWSGLKVTDARKALEANTSQLDSFIIDKDVYWFLPKNQVLAENSCLLLPAFDEYIISYKNRDAVLKPEYGKHAISSNGIFKPVVVLDGQVVGIWKRTNKKAAIDLEFSLFTDIERRSKNLIEKTAKTYGIFEGKELNLYVKDI